MSARVLLAGGGPPAAATAEALTALGHHVTGPFDADPPPDGPAPDLGVVCGARAGVDVLRRRLPRGAVVLNCCAPPWESTARLVSRLGRADLLAVSNPHRADESATEFLHPELVVLGAATAAAADVADELYRGVAAPRLRTDAATADLLPQAVDGYLAVRRAFTDELAALCSALGADIGSVAEALSYDARTGRAPLTPAVDDGAALAERAYRRPAS